MRAPAAGSAGGRAWWSAALATGLLTTAAVGTAAPAGAAHLTAHLSAPPAAPAPEASVDPDRPVDIEVGRLEPRTVTDGSTVTITGTLTNTGGSPIRDLDVRLQRGDVMTTRAELAAAERDPDEAGSVLGPFEPISGTLDPGESLPFSYAIPAEDLRLGADGVYPVLVNVNATGEDGARRRVGELSSYLLRRPAVPRERTTVAWLWPVVDGTSRGPTGGFADDELARSVGPGGRLDQALAVLEGLPRTEEAGAERPAVPVAVAVDPALVEELGVMAAGPYPVGPDGTPGAGTEAAADFLARLQAVAAVHPVVALPYGDVDADALESAGLADVVTRSLPGTVAGTAQGAEAPAPEPPGSEQPTAAPGSADAATAAPGTAETPPAGTGAPSPAPAPEDAAPQDDEQTLGAGARILADALGVAPRTDLAWAAGGSFRAETVSTLRNGGVSTVVLGPGGVTAGERAVGLDVGAANARAQVGTADGELEVLVADAGLGAVVDGAENWTGGPRIAEQRYLAELALIGQQAPDGSTVTVLVAPSREVAAGPDGAGAMMADTAGLPWLAPSSLADLEAAAPLDAGRLTDPTDAVLLDPGGLADVVAAERTRDDLAGAVAGEPDEVLSSYDAATARTVSVSFRDQPEGFRAGASALRTAFGRLLGQVSLLAPADGTYSLASRDSPLPLTVQNDLPFTVSVQVDLSTPNTRSIRIGDIGAPTLEPGERTTLEVPVEVRQSGRFTVRAALTTPGGATLGEPVRLQVRSTAYGTISLLITFGAAGLLGLLFLRRFVRLLLRRRRAVPADAPPPAPEGAAVPLPPTRSPV